MGSRPRAGSRLVWLAIVVALLGGGCGGSASSESSERRAARGQAGIALEGLAFAPKELTVAAGTTVTWTNEDTVEHTVTSGVKGKQGVPGVSKGEPDRPDGAFDRELAGRGESYSFTFDDPGTYEYFCRIHGGMTGLVIVE